MSVKPRYVIDTNTLVSALLFAGSLPNQALEKAVKQGTLLFSEVTVDELIEVISRTKFDKYILRVLREEFVIALVRDAVIVSKTLSIKASRDPKDDKFIELALAGSASCIITGDKDLLELHPFQNIPILTAKDFLEASLT
jgi:uncharacterized protein